MNKYQEKFLKKRREQHLCIWCGKPIDCNSKSFCSSCLERKRQNYRKKINGCDWYDCETCPHEDCIANEKKAINFINRKNEMTRKSYHKLKNTALCHKCHKNTPEINHKYCKECLLKEKDRYNRRKYKLKENYIVKVKKSDTCVRCGKEIYKGKLCKEHYDICLQNLSKVKVKGEAWKNDNLFEKIF